MNRGTKGLVLGSCAIAALATAAPGFAQSSDGATADSGADIIVTAQRRSENIQNIPIAISVVSGADLLAQNKTSSDDILRNLPGLEVRRGPQGAFINIRGISSLQGGGELDPGIAFSVDGVYNPFTEVSFLSFTDIDRIEVLKGPQGTLYGRNAIAGAINVITRSPDLNKFGGYAQVSAGNYHARGATGVLNVPLGSTLGVRVVGDYQYNKGYLSNGSDDTNVRDGRVKLLWEPSQAVKVQLNADYAKFAGQGAAPVIFPYRDDPYTAFPTPVEPYQRIRYWGGSGQADFDLGPATLTYIGGYKKKRNATATDGGGTFIRSFVNDEQHTEEARLASNSSSPLSWILGGYYYRGRNGSGLTFFGATIVQDVVTTSYAAFGQTTYAISDQFRLTGGLRFTRDHKVENGTNSTNGTLVSSISGIKFTWKNWTWRAGAEFDIAPHSMLYASVSTGFKAGGTSLVSGPAAQFDPEKLTAYEAGLKNRLFDNKLTLNLSGYYYDYSNYQAVFVAPNPAFGNAVVRRIANAGAAKIYGGEAEAVFSPTRHDRLSATFAYIHGRFGTYVVPTPAPGIFNDYSHSKLSTPPWTATAGYSHEFVIGGGVLTPTLNARFVGGGYRDGRQYAIATPTRPAGTYVEPKSYQESFTKLDFTLGYAWSHDRFRVSGYLRNLTDKVAKPTGSATSAYLEPPFTFGVSLYAGW